MAEILKARDLSRGGRPIVAVKRILPHLTEDQQFVTMFLDESRVLAELEHDNIIRTLEVGEVRETLFIALEYVFGPDARMLFHRSRRNERPIPIAIGCYVIAQVCAALDYAHERVDAEGRLLGLVHRDVSLQNILLSYEGDVKLTDFGIAMSAKNVARTEVGVVKGKFGYMSPEQIRGEPLDRRSDVFATGICLYELLTSERLFSGDSDYAAVERVRNVVMEPPSRWNRMIPSALEAIVMKALSRYPRDRYQTAADMRRALLAFMADSGNECSPRQLSQHLRAEFAEELKKQPRPETLRSRRPVRNEETGLAAFDHLKPVTSVSEPFSLEDELDAEPVAGAASGADPGFGGAVSAVVMRDEPWPQQERAVAEQAAAAWGPFGPAPDWTEPPAVEAVGAYAHSRVRGDLVEDEITRQMHVSEAYAQLGVAEPAPFGGPGGEELMQGPASLGGAPSPFESVPAPALPASVPPPAQPASVPPAVLTRMQEPTEQVALGREAGLSLESSATYGRVVAIVAAIVTLIAAALYLTRGTRPAAVHFSTSPTDAEVWIDGDRLQATGSPFFVEGLRPDVPHDLKVTKPGYENWTTQVSLSSAQVLRLPLVTLVPETRAASAAGIAPDEQHARTPRQAHNRRPAADRREASSRANERGGTADEGHRAAAARREADKREADKRDAKLEADKRVREQRRQEAARVSSAKRQRAAREAAKKEAAKRARASERKKPEPKTAAAEPQGFGLLRINSRPWSAVTIDGKPAGNTPLIDVKLSAGRHTVRLSNPQFQLNKSFRVRVRAGKTVTKVVNLQ